MLAFFSISALMTKEYIIRSSFVDYFGIEPSRVIENLNLLHVGDAFLIKSSSFIGMIGGAMYFSTIRSINVMVEETLFNNCTALEAGAVFFSCENSGFVMDKVCGSDCFTDSDNDCQFGYIKTGTSKLNGYNMTTMTHCAPSSITNNIIGLKLVNGKQNLTYCNFTYNFGKTHPTLHSETVHSELKFCTIAKNVATSNYILQKSASSTNGFIKCNIIDNTSPSIVLNIFSQSYFSDCIIQRNSNTLFQLNAYCYITNGWLKHPNNLVNIPSYVLLSGLTNSIEETETLFIQHLSTQQCYVEYGNYCYPNPTPTECYAQNTDGVSILNLAKVFAWIYSTSLEILIVNL